ELIVRHGSMFENRQVKNIRWPGKSLLVEVKHGDKNIIPKGDTEIKDGDYLSILTDVNSESRITEILNGMNGAEEEEIEKNTEDTPK
ncbi:MAG TPA: TrkA C-terminal domain-containing protein, partial [Lachnospiraceae bacterium]|nr:TrkA C-terminal domain-containing protein [Lachnospiraceae bacterium]